MRFWSAMRKQPTAVAAEIGGHADGIACDVTDEKSVRAAFDQIVEKFGGVDIVVSNAGAAWQGRIGEVDEEILRRSFELNFFAHQRVAQNAVRIMQAQDTGGCLLFNTSKQAVNPGKDFGPYGLPKAATLFLVRQYAPRSRQGWYPRQRRERRSNPQRSFDRRDGGETLKGPRLSEKDYMSGNLLGREVTADDVAEAFIYLALAEKTTAAVVTVDGGNIEASLR